MYKNNYFCRKSCRELGKFDHLFQKSKDGANHEVRSFARYVIVSTSVVLVFLCFLIHDNAFRLVKSVSVAKQQEKQMKAMEKEISEMDKEMHYLTNDRDSLEKFAREKFGFSEAGEDVYLIQDK